jgi:CheY-like chemotaxis protein
VPGKVLIADDSLKIQKELSQLVQGLGVEVTTVSNGEHAVRQLATVNPDLVLADIFMPVRTGYEVCDYIKSREEFAHTAVLLLASKMEPYDEKEALRVRADGKLEKPITGAEEAALALIKQHLGRVLAVKPAPPIDEFAAAVPSTEAAEPEPEPEVFATAPPPVSFDESSPMGFAEMVEAEPAPEEAAPAPLPAEPEEQVDLSQATMLTTADELKKRIAEAQAMAASRGVGEETVKITKPQLAEPWEMMGPEPGAPEIPPAGGEGWDSQWKGMSEEAPAATVEEEVPAAAVEEEVPAAAVEEEAPVAAVAGRPYNPDEFAAAFGGAAEGEAALAPAEVEEEASAEAAVVEDAVVAEELSATVGAAPAVAVDPVVVEEIVNKVLERLSPQVMEAVAREIVRPLAEALLREKLRE